MSKATRRKQRREKAKTNQVITKGWMKLGPDYEAGTWRGWRVHADPADDRMPVTIVRGHDQGDT